MDTKLRKSHKLAKVIIALCVMLPALFLVSLYPMMEEAMLDKRAYYEELELKQQEEHGEWILEDNFVNYAMEAGYYLYAQMLQETTQTVVDFDIFRQFGWDSDFQLVRDNTTYVATYTPTEQTEPIVKKNSDEIDSSTAKLVLSFDSYGNLTEASLTGELEFYEGQENTFTVAQRSNMQFQDNIMAYNDEYEKALTAEQYIPKSFQLVLGLNERSHFVTSYDELFVHGWYDVSAENLYGEIGAFWIVLILVLFVVVAAFTLPFVRSLNTGKERLFSMSFEFMIVVGICATFLTIGMYFIMTESTMTGIAKAIEYSGQPVILGQAISTETLYFLIRAANFVGWSVSFFLIYAVAANLRQLVSNTKYYLKYQTWTIRFFRWLKRKFVSLYNYVTDIDINSNMDKSILKVVVANFVILTLLCCMWFFGVAALIIYSIALFVVLRKQCLKIQKQYHSILRATEQMAEGDLKISLEEELGIFEPIGTSLAKVQQGFEKAVVEEAKSQNMKTELITNVSHDLKTPLTAIITYVDLLKNEDITEEERKSYIRTLEQKSQRLKVLIEDLFEVSKAHSGNVKMNFMDVDVVSLLKQVRSEMDEQIVESNLQFRWNFPEEKVLLSLDGQRTYRVFENLLNNILKYAMPNSRVYVDVRNTESQVQILFRNVSALELDFDAERLTERFVRGDSARNSEGSGLGLAIAKSFIELQKGTFKIEVDGDLFKVYISFQK